MTAQRILLFGDSHTYALQRAIERRQAKQMPVPVQVHRLLKTKAKQGVNVTLGDTSLEQFLEIVAPLGPEEIVLSMIGGNQHAVFSTIQHPVAFDFLEPGGDADAPATGCTLIPFRTLSGHFTTGIHGGDGKSLEALRKATRARVIHIIPPPPKRDNDFIRNYHETHFSAEDIASLGVSSPELRMKFWKLQTSVLTDLCESSGIEIMMPPEEACDADGFLAPDYYANDATHANPLYGELVLRQVEGLSASANSKGGAA